MNPKEKSIIFKTDLNYHRYSAAFSYLEINNELHKVTDLLPN